MPCEIHCLPFKNTAICTSKYERYGFKQQFLIFSNRLRKIHPAMTLMHLSSISRICFAHLPPSFLTPSMIPSETVQISFVAILSACVMVFQQLLAMAFGLTFQTMMLLLSLSNPVNGIPGIKNSLTLEFSPLVGSVFSAQDGIMYLMFVRYVDVVLTIPKGTLFPMCGMNLAFDRDLIGPAMYFGLMGDGQPIGRYDDMWAGWCIKVCHYALQFMYTAFYFPLNS